MSGTFANLLLVILEEDHRRDYVVSDDDAAPTQDYKWKQCGSKTIVYSYIKLNGDLMCLENPNGTSIQNLWYYCQ